MRIHELKHAARVIIFGFGIEGQASWEALQDRLDNLIITDKKDFDHPAFVPIEKAFELITERDVILRSPGISLNNEWLKKASDAGAKITSATRVFLAEKKGKYPLVGITGTKGKSTTASLLDHVLSNAGISTKLVGNIGEPMLKYLDDKSDSVYVMELSSHQLEDLDIGPDIGVILNLFPEHMEHHGSVEDYYLAKSKMALADKLIVHPDLKERFPNAESFAEEAVNIRAHLQLKGEHNVQNARAVVSVARELNVPDEMIFNEMDSFKGLPHRLEEFAVVEGVTFVDDTISTAPESAIAAIEVYKDQLGYIILGGQDRGYDFSELAGELSMVKNLTVYMMPGSERLQDALKKEGIEYIFYDGFEKIVSDVMNHKKPDSICLLSPASPSYNQFSNYEEKGSAFKEVVFDFRKKNR